MHAGNEAMIAEIVVQDSRDVIRGQVGQADIEEGAHGYGFRFVPSRFLDNLRLTATSLDCRTAGVLSMSQFRSLSRTTSEDRWGAINSHIVSRAQLGQREVYSKRKQ